MHFTPKFWRLLKKPFCQYSSRAYQQREQRVRTTETRHIASTSMYSLTFRVRVTTSPQYGRNRTTRAAGVSILSQARGVFAGMRSVRCGGPGGLPLGSATHFHSAAIATQPVHRLQIRPTVHNWGHPLPFPKLHPGPCNSVGIRPRTDRQRDRQTRVITIHFSRSIRLTRDVTRN